MRDKTEKKILIQVREKKGCAVSMRSLPKRTELGSSQYCILGGWDTIISWKKGYLGWLYKLLHREDSEQWKRLPRVIVPFLPSMVFKNRWNKILSGQLGRHGWPLHATGWTRHLLSYRGREVCHLHSTMEIQNSFSAFFLHRRKALAEQSWKSKVLELSSHFLQFPLSQQQQKR